MRWGWFDLAFPWIGLCGAALLLVLLFATRRLCADASGPRWRDRTWLAWMAVVAYLVHNVEEYGLDALGHVHSFPAHFSLRFGLPDYPDNPIPPLYWVAINISLVWIAGPLAALLARRHPIVGLSMLSVVFVNGLAHVLQALALGSYNPGLATAIAVFLPLSAWVGHACFGRDRLGYPVMALLVAHGVLLHAILLASTVMFLNGFIGAGVLVAAQLLNAGLLLLLPLCVEKWCPGVLPRTGRA